MRNEQKKAGRATALGYCIKPNMERTRLEIAEEPGHRERVVGS